MSNSSENPTLFSTIVKRNGSHATFDPQRIIRAIAKAGKATGAFDVKEAKRLTQRVLAIVAATCNEDNTLTIEFIQDAVEDVLMTSPYRATARAYIIYREQHRVLRELRETSYTERIQTYLDRSDWKVSENANMTYSLQGLNNHVAGDIARKYWLEQLYPPHIREAHVRGDFHIHDLNLLAVYCVGWDLADLLRQGFCGVSGKTESKPAKHFQTALNHITNFFYTLQGEAAGAIALSNIDTLLAPFIAHDKLTYKGVKQAVQAWVFNMNVATRVGFQCLSEDTEILTKKGWCKHNEVTVGDIIATFNLENKAVEYLPAKHVFAKHYSGTMYNLIGRNSDQLVSPKHRVVRRFFNTDHYIREPIEDVMKLNEPIIVPLCTAGNINGDDTLDEDLVRLAAWILADGRYYTDSSGIDRISIYPSQTRSVYDCIEIKNTLQRLGINWVDDVQTVIKQPWQTYRFDDEASQRITEFFNFTTYKNTLRVPNAILCLGPRLSKLFLDTYIDNARQTINIPVMNTALRDDLMMVAANAGYCTTSYAIASNYTIRILTDAGTHIQKIVEIPYEGIIWCPNTDNETIIARRKGKVFITGNTPFTNITLDLNVPKHLHNTAVTLGGKLQDSTYGEFQHEMDLFNKAFLEIMVEGDAKGRVFTFPIPTYNITKDFNYDDPRLDPLWKVTARYGIPYFANFVNSNMSPDDARSMCCRLRLDKRELRRRGGGLFGADPLTGSIGVVTLNLPRLGHLATDEWDFFQRLTDLMDIARDSLVLKRKVLEQYTASGLYPYSKHYLTNIYQRYKAYWYNHFSTIGIIGLEEAAQNLFGTGLQTRETRAFGLAVLSYIRARLATYQTETKTPFNLEATPAEGTCYRLVKLDRKHHPTMPIFASNNEDTVYSNSSQPPVEAFNDPFALLEQQDEFQTKYTGGTVLHFFLGERIEDPSMVKEFVRTVCTNYRLPYFTLTPTFSICPKHGYIAGEQPVCPQCGSKTEVYSRIVGYLRPIEQWNTGKQQEFKRRGLFEKKLTTPARRSNIRDDRKIK